MHDVLSADAERWQFVEKTARDHFALYGFAEIRTPIVEQTALFERSVGALTDIVQKEMFTFEDKDHDSLTLRPEGTAGVVRAVLEHNLINSQSPDLKVFYLGPMFRRERPQKGRYRQFYQIGVENFGSSSPLADAETIEMLARFLNKVGVSEWSLHLNSLGQKDDRTKYQDHLRLFFEKNKNSYCTDCQERMDRNPLRVLDCKKTICQELATEHPVILDFLNDESLQHFKEVQNILTQMGIPFLVNPKMVRGLDYYQRTVFEFTCPKLGAQSAVAAGGRYDSLVKDLGGPDSPGVGFALGVERLLLLLPEKLEEKKNQKIFIAFLGEKARTEALTIASGLRIHSLECEMNYEVKSLKSQMRRADQIGSSHVIILGEDELKKGMAAVRNLNLKTQEEVSLQSLVNYFKK